MLDFGKYCISLLFISKKLNKPWIVQQFFEDRVYYSLANLLLGSLRVFFSNNVDIKFAVDLLLDDLKRDSIVFLFFPSLSGNSEVSSRSIHYISDLFFFKHDLSKVGLLRPIFKATELLSFALTIVGLISHFADLDDLEEGKNVILVPVVIT